MIICTEHTLAIGERVIGPVTDANLVRHDVAFVVLSETTEENYRSHAIEVAGYVGPQFVVPHRFYVVVMD